MTHQGPAEERDPSDGLEGVLRKAFGGQFDEREHKASILKFLEGRAGSSMRLKLFDPAHEETSVAKSVPLNGGRSRYIIAGEIAQGGMGVIFKGRDVDLGRDVAIKVLQDRFASNHDVIQRFVEEAQIGGQLQHPGIVPVYEMGLQEDGRPFFAMKLVKGRTLASLLASRTPGASDQRRFLTIFEAVCQTLAYAHSRRVIHRDLTPANVMVGAFGEVQVVDWGLAKVLRSGGIADEGVHTEDVPVTVIETVRSSSADRPSMTGSVFGTPAYMSPEQARGEIEALDERSDVFCLGAILTEILTGQPPYGGPRKQVLDQAARAELGPAFERLEASGAEPELVALCCECMSQEPAGRPPDARAVADRVQNHLATLERRAEAAQIEEAEARVRARKARRARRLTAELAAVILVAVVGALGGWWWIGRLGAERTRETGATVRAALSEAALARGRGAWSEALVAVRRAQDLAQAGDAQADLVAEVAAHMSTIRLEAREAEERDLLEQKNAELSRALIELRLPEGEAGAADWALLDGAMAEVLRANGLELDGALGRDWEETWRSRGIPAELAAALDDWSFVRRAAGDGRGAARLSRMAATLDPDPVRCEIREFSNAERSTDLRALVQGEDLEDWEPRTLVLLGKALKESDHSDSAVAVMGGGILRHPDDFGLRLGMARLFSSSFGSSEGAWRAAQHYRAALALRPDGVELRHELGRALAAAGAPGAAVDLFRQALDLSSDDQHLRLHLGRSLEDLGRLEAQRAAEAEAEQKQEGDAANSEEQAGGGGDD